MKHILLPTVLLLLVLFAGCDKKENVSHEISLNGTWELARTDSSGTMPSEFQSVVPVPGLVDMATPVQNDPDTSYQNSIYWYQTTFSTDKGNYDFVRLKINKSMYHTRVYVNGHFVGENVYSFTPSLFEIKPYLSEGRDKNQLVISVGCRDQLPDTVANGHDFEKIIYQPGIYDDVKLIYGQLPYIENVQIVPDMEKGEVSVVGEISCKEKTAKVDVQWKILELKSGKQVSEGTGICVNKGNSTTAALNFTTPVPDCHPWTPEDPFLYKIELTTGNSQKTIRFGMRSFRLNAMQGKAILNGKTYYMRGTNVCIFRFFEDPTRATLPWEKEWPVMLHQRFKSMNWNSIRYCIGFPPERWYDIADSLGFLIQDEFPIWTGGPGGFKIWQKEMTAGQLAAEYAAWMKERWNHACVVIWDAQNESVTPVTAAAINKVRQLDLSERPWDNGWAAPAGSGDALESHPYLFSKYTNTKNKPGKNGVLYDLFSIEREPDNDPNQHMPDSSGKQYENAIIINEYGWIWLNRDGTPTTLTDNVYANVFPDARTANQKYEVYARNIAMLTEYWRSSRNSAAVMHFCGLGYSRPEAPRGQTSDNFTDIRNLKFEPAYYNYVSQAFNPVGIMIAKWEKYFTAGEETTFPIHVINDRIDSWEGNIKVSLMRGETVIEQSTIAAKVENAGKGVFTTRLRIPSEKGKYQCVAELTDQGRTIKSIRDFTVN